jgi:hypothetical protein
MNEKLKEFEEFLATIDPDDPRLIARWVDEMRPVPEAAGGYTVKQVVSLTVTARVRGGHVQREFPDLKKEDIQPLLVGQRYVVTFLSGNKNR